MKTSDGTLLDVLKWKENTPYAFLLRYAHEVYHAQFLAEFIIECKRTPEVTTEMPEDQRAILKGKLCIVYAM